jgi:TM2 domain-containing membrane protein YozV
MSDFKCSCPNCGQHIAYNESYFGVQINCPACNTLINIPAPTASAGQASGGSVPPNVKVPGGLKISSPPPPPAPLPRTQSPNTPGKMRAPSKPMGKSWLTTFLFAWFLGGLGVDRFYTGRIGLGIGKLLTAGACGVWGLIDVILLLAKKYQDAQGNYLRPAKRNHMVIALSVVGVTILINVIVMVTMVQKIKSEISAGMNDMGQSISCMNNLKQVGLAFRQWSIDHDDQFPFNVPAGKGGTLEYCQVTADGFDANAFLHFKALSNLLGTPRLLVCPADASKQPATDWGSLDSSHVTYLLRSGTQVSEKNPNEVLARCPIHGINLYCDGRVELEKNR